MTQTQLGRTREEFSVALIGARPASLDIIEAHLIEPGGDRQAVVNRQRNIVRLQAVAQGGIVNVDFTAVRHRLTKRWAWRSPPCWPKRRRARHVPPARRTWRRSLPRV